MCVCLFAPTAVSIASVEAAAAASAFFFSLAFALAVTERTAVATCGQQRVHCTSMFAQGSGGRKNVWVHNPIGSRCRGAGRGE